MMSHRSGETEDDFIADLAVGLATGQIKVQQVVGMSDALYSVFRAFSLMCALCFFSVGCSMPWGAFGEVQPTAPHRRRVGRQSRIRWKAV